MWPSSVPAPVPDGQPLPETQRVQPRTPVPAPQCTCRRNPHDEGFGRVPSYSYSPTNCVKYSSCPLPCGILVIVTWYPEGACTVRVLCPAQYLDIIVSTHQTWLRFPAHSPNEGHVLHAIGLVVESHSSEEGKMFFGALLERVYWTCPLPSPTVRQYYRSFVRLRVHSP